MTPIRGKSLIQGLLIVMVQFAFQLGDTSIWAQPAPEFIVLDAAQLSALRDQIAADDSRAPAWLEPLIAAADSALAQPPLTVIDKPETPPSGDKRDYMSVGPYWWPDPTKPDGLPYIRRDGEVHPDRRKDDSATLGRMTSAVSQLALGYYFTGDERYARHAATLLRTWFLDERTRMNPHLRYGQAIPGRNEGRYIGIIDTVRLVHLLDPVRIVATSSAWSETDQAGLEQWFTDYLQWLTTSQFGKQERNHPNNHGTWFDVQVVSFARFVGDDEMALSVLREVVARRIAQQIAPDGSQPEELSRTKALGYCIYNLQALLILAHLAEPTEIDLWNTQTDDGRSIRQALAWLAPYVTEQEPFPHQQISKPNWSGAARIFRMAGYAYDSEDDHRVADFALSRYKGTVAPYLLRP